VGKKVLRKRETVSADHWKKTARPEKLRPLYQRRAKVRGGQPASLVAEFLELRKVRGRKKGLFEKRKGCGSLEGLGIVGQHARTNSHSQTQKRKRKNPENIRKESRAPITPRVQGLGKGNRRGEDGDKTKKNKT